MQQSRYQSVAISICERILKGELQEGQKIKGRTSLAGEYQVSSETIRKAMHILSKYKVVTIKHGVGIFIESKAKANDYLQSLQNSAYIAEKETEFDELFAQKRELDFKLEQRVKEWVNAVKFKEKEIIPIRELPILSSSWIVGQTIGEIYFYNYTECTIAAVKKGEDFFFSPGPDYKIEADDVLYLIPKDELSYDRAQTYILYGAED